MDQAPQTNKRHILTVLLEDYFHVASFNGLIQRGQWYRFETRFEQNTLKALDLLDRYNIKATFFVMGWVADRQPELVREVARRGHEIASRGLYQRRRTRRMTSGEFREDLRLTREAVELASGTKVYGFRAAHRWSSPSELWMLDVLAEEGYQYDSSLLPIARAFRREPWRRFAHEHVNADKRIWEFPLSTFNVLNWRIPIAGGNYFRQAPHSLLRHAVEHWHRNYDAPFVMYTHIWELDPLQPRISGASPLTKLRHYRNLDKMSWVLEEYFKKYNFTGIASYMGLNDKQEATDRDGVEAPLEREARVERRRAVLTLAAPSAEPQSTDKSFPLGPTPITIVVPCFNEALILPYLANTLKSLEATLKTEYDLRLIFVDDCSTDGTNEALHRLFGSEPRSKILRHNRNLGVAAAILNGIRHAETEIVCSIDCDCTYDPHELPRMIPLLADDVALVTASPYHPAGHVRNVPPWRLFLSKSASFLYRKVVRQRLFTYTSCFRVYRRSALVDIRLAETGFLGVAETVGRLDALGARIVEYPATLEVRLFGQSKMKVLRTIRGHLRMLARLAALRIRQKQLNRVALATDAVQAVSLSNTYQSQPIPRERT